MTKKILLLLSVLTLNSCVVRHGDFTVISNKLVRLSQFKIDQADRKRNFTGKDVQHIIIFFPTSGQPTLDGAMDNAFDEGEGDVMTDATIKSWGWYIPYIYGQSGWSIKGDVIKTRK
jgi:hypothetical protein